MKAAILFGNEDIRYEEYPTPELLPGMVLIQVKATGICGSDIPRVLYNGAHWYPIVLGHEFSGVVIAVGEGVTRIHAGMHVSGAPLLPCLECEDCQKGDYALCRNYGFVGSRQQGSFAEFVALPERNIIPFDESVSFIHGALFEPSAVALHGLKCNRFRGGEHVAVLGGGTIGQFTAQWARIMGARTVTMFDLLNDRLDLARELGADYGINTTKSNFMDEAMDLTNGRGYSAVFESAGTPATMRMAFRLAGCKARICFIGTPQVDLSFQPAEWEMMNRKEFILTGSWMSYSAPFPGKEWEITAHCFATGQLKYDPKLIYKSIPLSKTAEAFMLYKNPSQVHGKIMLLNE